MVSMGGTTIINSFVQQGTVATNAEGHHITDPDFESQAWDLFEEENTWRVIQ
jgi:hypothetical protein